MTTIITTKIIEIDVNESHFIRGVLLRCFFILILALPEDANMTAGMFLDLGWFFIFELFFEVIDKSINVFRVFSKCLE